MTPDNAKIPFTSVDDVLIKPKETADRRLNTGVHL